MVIGVVTQPKKNTKAHVFKRIFGCIPVKRAVCAENPFELIIAILPYDAATLRRKSVLRVRKIAERAKRKLAKKGAEPVVFSETFMDIFCEKGLYEYCGQQKNSKELFLKYAPLCIRQTADEIGMKLFESRVCISDGEMERISEYLINSLCFDVKNLTVITQKEQKANEICEKFYDETGFLIEVRTDAAHKFDILIDVDKGCVRFGNNLAVRGADMGYNLFGYDINQQTLALAAKDAERAPEGWIFDHKKYVDFIR